MGITAPLDGVCDQSDCPAEITREVVGKLLWPYYGHITQVGGVCAQCAGLRNRGLLSERGRHFIYLIMPSSVYSSPFISIEYLPIYFDQGRERAQMFFSTMRNRWCPQALQGSVSAGICRISFRQKNRPDLAGLHISSCALHNVAPACPVCARADVFSYTAYAKHWQHVR